MLKALAVLGATIALLAALLPAASGDHAGGNLVRGAEKDAIPAITDPSFDTDEAYANGNDLVIGLSLNGDSRAYPVKVLTRHEIVDDTVGGIPVAVTYCPLCGTGIVFDRTVNGDPLEFRVSGLLWNSDLVMYDTATDSYWSQVEGLAIEGPLHGAALDVLDAKTITWRGWRELHPETKLLDRPFPEFIDYDRDPYAYGFENYYESDSVWFPVENEDGQRRLHPKAKVVGVELGNESKAYALSLLEREPVINDVVGGTPVVVTFFDGSGQVFLRGEDAFSHSSGREMRDAGGNAYDLVSGTGPAGSLEPVRSLTVFWFAWYAFNPGTSLYLAPESPSGDSSGLWAVLFLGAVAAVAGVWWLRRRK